LFTLTALLLEEDELEVLVPLPLEDVELEPELDPLPLDPDVVLPPLLLLVPALVPLFPEEPEAEGEPPLLELDVAGSCGAKLPRISRAIRLRILRAKVLRSISCRLACT
jgi:hypothetical protein